MYFCSKTVIIAVTKSNSAAYPFSYQSLSILKFYQNVTRFLFLYFHTLFLGVINYHSCITCTLIPLCFIPHSLCQLVQQFLFTFCYYKSFDTQRTSIFSQCRAVHELQNQTELHFSPQNAIVSVIVMQLKGQNLGARNFIEMSKTFI